MYRILLSTLVLFLCVQLASADNTCITKDQNLSEIDRLYYSGKIWGFLKYYHPLVGRGAFDWDESLQKMLKNTSGMQTYEQYSDYLAQWLYYLGQIPPCNGCRNSDNQFRENFDLSWTQNRSFSEKLRSTLKKVEKNRFNGNHHYIGQGKAGQFEPKNENEDFDFDWTDPNKRLLLLFRYWNYIEYFYPYKYQTEQSWDDVLREMIPVFQKADTQLDLHLALLELVVKADDTQGTFMSSLIDKLPYYSYLPVQLELIEGKVAITKIIDRSKAKADDLQIGDVIVSINNQSVNTVLNQMYDRVPGSNKAVKNRSISYNLFMGITGSANVSFERNGSRISKEVSLYAYTDLNPTTEPNGPKWKSIIDTTQIAVTTLVMDTASLISPTELTDSLNIDSLNMMPDTTWIEVTTMEDVIHKVGYVDLGQLSAGEVGTVMNEFMDAKAIIFDVRNKPRGTYKAIANYLMPTENKFAAYIKPDFSYPGKFVWSGESTCGEYKSDSSFYQGKVILLVNEVTQSSSEFTCMCLQTAPNVVVVGTQSAGTIGNSSRFSVWARYYATMTGTGVLYPDGRPVQRTGIVPDIAVNRTLTGIKMGQDEILNKAIEEGMQD